MRNFLVCLFLLSVSIAYAQSTNEYALAAGKSYWKNRKPFQGYWQQDVHYTLKVAIDDTEESVAGSEHLIYFNNSPDTLIRVYFHLYQNAFTPNSYVHNLRKSGKLQTTFGEHEAKGVGTEIVSLQVNGISADFTVDNTLLYIDLSQPILPGGSAEFDLDFKTFWDKQDGGNMRRRMKTFAHDGVTHFDGVHWYPRICVYDRKFGWTTDQHLGKEFYGNFGLYEVELTFPNQYIVEATGELQNTNEAMPPSLREAIDIKNYKTQRTELTQPIPADGTAKTWKYRAVNVHDFAFTADPTYRMGEVDYNGVRCIALVQEKNAHLWQPTAEYLKTVVEIYSQEIGPYGYPKIIVADARDGMEYPMLTLNSGNWPGHRYVIAHEVGHNWFFGMIGNNETYQASLDEGFTQFLTALSLKKLSRQDFYGNLVDKGVVYGSYMSHAANENTATLNVHSDHYNSADRHGGGYSQVYFKTATMLYNLQYVLGDALFSQVMKDYFARWQYAHPYWEDFKASAMQTSKTDLNWFFDEWIESNHTIDYKVAKVKKSKNAGHTITLKRKTTMQMPLDVNVEFADGSIEKHYIPNTYFTKKTDAIIQPKWTGWDQLNTTYKFNTTSTASIKNVQIDPSGRMADVYRLDNSSKTPIDFRFSRYKALSEDYDTYNLRWHPNVWYNRRDGIQAGIDLFGGYFGGKHLINTSVWYNTGILSSFPNLSYSSFSYKAKYQTRIARLTDLSLESRYMDGLRYQQVGVSKEVGVNTFEIYAKSLYRNSVSDVINMFYPSDWASKAWNNTLNMKWQRPLRFENGNGSIAVSTRGAFILSDYNYAKVDAELLRNFNVKKLNIRTRLFAQYGSGDFAPESKLMLAGASAEYYADEPLLRSVSLKPFMYTGYQNHFDNVHLGGGLNLRGMSGYAAANDKEGTIYHTYAGNSGAAVNMEVDFTSYFKVSRAPRNLKMNTYLFGDMCILQTADATSGVRADAGIGTLVTWRPIKYNYIKPVSIRVDFPLFVNRIPYNQTDYWAFRWVLGVSRAF
jgi:hypothetical protein